MHHDGERVLFTAGRRHFPTVILRGRADHTCHSLFERGDCPTELVELGGNRDELRPELFFPRVRFTTKSRCRRRGRLPLLRRPPKELARLGDIVLDKQVESLVEGESFL